MGSRPQAGGGASAHAVSRRSLLAGASAVALPVPAATAVLDPPAAGSPGPGPGQLFRSWLAIDSRIERLQTRWAKLESWLIQNHNWCELSAPEQRALPWARELRDIEGCLDLLFEQRCSTDYPQTARVSCLNSRTDWRSSSGSSPPTKTARRTRSSVV